ncbi:MAG: phosphoribosylformylglycinamidine cyclo-ligase, partial [Elusimicrobia bacterium]
MAALTYRDSGVDIDKKSAMLDRIGAMVKSTFGPGVLHEVGSFGGMFSGTFAGIKDPVLVATNDGVGTKVRIGVKAGRVRGLGHDIVNHCVNDALVQGAEPIFFLDYFGASRLDDAVFHEVIAGMTEACRRVGAALLGGETAEMPNVYAPGEFDVVGFLVGVVDRSKVWPRNVHVGDVLLGVRSDGLHTNGYSLVNRLLDRDHVDLSRDPGGLGEPLADALLRPHRCYLDPVRRLRDHVEVHALAHVTGGGIEENLPRVLPAGVGAVIERASWTPNPVFRWIVKASGISEAEAYHVYNMGCGLLVAVPPRDAERALKILGDAGEDAWVAGRLAQGEGV